MKRLLREVWPENIGDLYFLILATAGIAGIAAGVYEAVAVGPLWLLVILVVPASGILIWISD